MTLDELATKYKSGYRIKFKLSEAKDEQWGEVKGVAFSLPRAPGSVNEEPAIVIMTTKGSLGHVYPDEVLEVIPTKPFRTRTT
jgi:hypothetical protein